MKNETYLCAVCLKRHDTYETGASVCCLKTNRQTAKKETVRADENTNCDDCKRFIPVGWKVRISFGAAVCFAPCVA